MKWKKKKEYEKKNKKKKETKSSKYNTFSMAFYQLLERNKDSNEKNFHYNLVQRWLLFNEQWIMATF